MKPIEEWIISKIERCWNEVHRRRDRDGSRYQAPENELDAISALDDVLQEIRSRRSRGEL